MYGFPTIRESFGESDSFDTRRNNPPPGESQLEDIKSTTLGVYEGAGEILLLRPWVC